MCIQMKIKLRSWDLSGWLRIILQGYLSGERRRAGGSGKSSWITRREEKEN